MSALSNYAEGKIIDHLFVFEGNGKVTDFPGNYTQYRNAMEEAAAGTSVSGGKATGEPPHRPARKEENPKLTFREKREMESLETEIAALESLLPLVAILDHLLSSQLRAPRGSDPAASSRNHEMITSPGWKPCISPGAKTAQPPRMSVFVII